MQPHKEKCICPGLFITIIKAVFNWAAEQGHLTHNPIKKLRRRETGRRERLQRLVAAGGVRRWLYATAGRGALSYHTLSPLGFRLLHGDDCAVRRRRSGPVGVALHRHTLALAEVIVHALVAAHRAGYRVEAFHPENARACETPPGHSPRRRAANAAHMDWASTARTIAAGRPRPGDSTHGRRGGEVPQLPCRDGRLSMDDQSRARFV